MSETMSAEQAAELAELQAMVEPSAEETQAAAAVEQTAEEAQNTAGLLVEVAATGAEHFWPCLSYGPEVRKTAAEKLAPVLQKYGVTTDFLGNWQAEISAAIFFGGLIFTSYKQVKEYEATRSREAGRANEAAAGGAQPDFMARG